MEGNCDAETVIEWLEKQQIHWLPNHHQNKPLETLHVERLAKHGVQQGDTTLQAMTKVHAVAGFPPLKPRRF